MLPAAACCMVGPIALRTPADLENKQVLLTCCSDVTATCAHVFAIFCGWVACFACNSHHTWVHGARALYGPGMRDGTQEKMASLAFCGLC